MKKKNRQNNLVSIIINCHNGEEYLDQCIKSIIKQTYKNWEIIFYDNKSVDNSIKILKNFKDKRIKLYSNKKKLWTLYKARNLAIRKAKGRFVTFLDVDDLWNKNFLKKNVKKIKKLNCEIIYSKYFILDENQKKIFLKTKKKLSSGYITQDLLNNYNIGILAVMLKKRVFKKYKFNNKYNIIGDFDFFLRLSLEYEFFTINEPLALYRVHSRNYTLKNILTYYLEIKQWYKKNFYLFKKYNLFKIKYYIIKLKLKYYLKLIYLKITY
jgi:glycosyltransferase involved in cell wall biosynthesis